MKFYITSEESAKYIVTEYSSTVEDHWYYPSYREALEKYNKIIDRLTGYIPDLTRGTVVSIYDLKKDVRKNFHRF